MRFKKLMLMLVSIILIVVSMLTPFAVNAQDTEDEELATLLIGTVTDNEDEFVGIAIDGENVTIYICDGRADEGTVSIAQWFVGAVADNAIAITATNGNRVEATISEDSASGVFTFADGTTKEFTLALADGDAALYRSEFTIGEDDFVGGWLVLPDGSVRGALFRVGTQELTPAGIMVIAVSHEIVSPRR